MTRTISTGAEVCHFFLSAQGPLEPQVASPNNQGIRISFKPLEISLMYIFVWVFRKIGGFPPKWMVKIMENPMNKWMILGGRKPTIFRKHPYRYKFQHKKENTCDLDQRTPFPYHPCMAYIPTFTIKINQM